MADNEEREEREEAEVEETTSEEVSEEAHEVEEERARVDENVHDESHHIMEAIEELSAQVKAMRIAVDSFAEMGGVIRESTEPTTTVEVTDGFDEDDEVFIDDDVIRDIDNIMFNE